MSANPVASPPDASSATTTSAARPRLWPGVLIVALLWASAIIPAWLFPGTMAHFMAVFFGPMIAAALFVAWWLLASRVSWRDRFAIMLACILIGVAAFALADNSVGVFIAILYGLPAVLTAWAGWLLLTSFGGDHAPRWPIRRAGLLVVFMLVWGVFAVLRYEGADGEFAPEFRLRWTQTAEEQFLADVAAGKLKRMKAAPSVKPLALAPGDWPAFRGPDRDGRLEGVRIDTDWDKSPPRLVWRHRVGPGWSSFAVVGKRIFTQEQRDKQEVVVCYDSDTGAELWAHSDDVRFTEPVGGPGPRATPTFHEGKLYTLGAKGNLNCLDPETGKSHWSRNIVADSKADIPEWGFASSPLIVDNIVTVFAGATDKSVLAYHADTGKSAWSAGKGKLSYGSTQLATIAGVPQLLMTTNEGVTSYDPVRGTVLWSHDWPVEGIARIVQPAVIDGTDILIGTGIANGTRRIQVNRSGDKWTTKELWTTRAISPYYNDFVVQDGHLYGFDGSFFTCVSLDKGTRKWRTRGYGNGQVLLLAEQKLLLILSEEGDAALVEATPAEHKELAKFRAIEGKTWNHPVVAHNRLFVRNSEEAACYRLADIAVAARSIRRTD